MTLRSKDIFYLNYEELQDYQDVHIKSKTGHVTINKLFLVIFSPMLKQIFAALEDKIDDNLTIITDFDQEDINTIVNFCYGYLPLSVETLSRSVPLELHNLFQAFGIDLQKVLFSEETFKVESNCLSFIAVDNPDGPPPTITTSYSIVSLDIY